MRQTDILEGGSMADIVNRWIGAIREFACVVCIFIGKASDSELDSGALRIDSEAQL